MVARPQNSARGNVAKAKFIIPTGGGIRADDYSTSSDLVSANSTALKLAGGLGLSGQAVYLTANSTALKSSGGLGVSGKAFYLTGNATGNVFSGALYLSGKTSKKLTSNSSGFISNGYLYPGRTSKYIHANSTAVIVQGALYVNTKQYIKANSTGLGFVHAGTKPTTAGTATLSFNTDSTGRYLSIRQTGTTWLYVQQTSVRPTK